MLKKWEFIKNNHIPIVAASIHSGHRIPSWIRHKLLVSEKERLHEEDPFTDILDQVTLNRIIVNISRFTVDLNRPLESSVYILPEQAWGLKVWKNHPGTEILSRLHNLHKEFYGELEKYLSYIRKKYKNFVILDIHSYNYKRNGNTSDFYDKDANPDINVGTATMKTSLWRPLINRFINDLSQLRINNIKLDVRENIKFTGGFFPLWIHENFKDNACVLSLEFRKVFMDELSGKLFSDILDQEKEALKKTLKGMLLELEKLGSSA